MPESSDNCVFCKIVAGGLPSMTVLDTRHAVAFLDIAPLAEAHLLVIPKMHCARLEALPADVLSAVVGCLPRLAAAVLEVSQTSDYNILQNNGPAAGQVVEHVHFHIIPRRPDDGLGYRWAAGSYPAGRAETLHRQLHRALQD